MVSKINPMISPNNKMPIIIGGVHRSGTSLIRRILNSHSNIYCGPEVKFFKDWHGDYINDPIKHARFIQSARSLLPEDELFQILGRAFIDMHEKAAQHANKKRWADKNPENVLHLGEWEKLLRQNWLFVHVVRNPLDTLASIKEAVFKFAIPEKLEDRITHYIRYTDAGLGYTEKCPDRSYRILYDQLVSSPKTEIIKLMNWLGEEFDESQLYFNNKNHQLGLEDPKVKHTTEIHSKSLGRWKKILSPKEADIILQYTSSLWNRIDANADFPIG